MIKSGYNPPVSFAYFKGKTDTSSVTAGAATPVLCGAPGRGSDMPPAYHSLPRLRFAYLKEKAYLKGKALFKEKARGQRVAGGLRGCVY